MGDRDEKLLNWYDVHYPGDRYAKSQDFTTIQHMRVTKLRLYPLNLYKLKLKPKRQQFFRRRGRDRVAVSRGVQGAGKAPFLRPGRHRCLLFFLNCVFLIHIASM